MSLSAGMYHVFLVVKEGFFHITNLALAKIEEGMSLRVSCMVEFDIYFYLFHKLSSLSDILAAVEKLDVDSLKEVS